MSNEPAAPARGNKVRWIITACLLVLAVLCVGWIVWRYFTTNPDSRGLPLEGVAVAGHVFPAFAALDVLALIGLGVWVLRPPVPGAVGFFGRWLGKVLLFLGLGLAIVIFLFATCMGLGALGVPTL